jgi:hypothetical protein
MAAEVRLADERVRGHLRRRPGRDHAAGVEHDDL